MLVNGHSQVSQANSKIVFPNPSFTLTYVSLLCFQKLSNLKTFIVIVCQWVFRVFNFQQVFSNYSCHGEIFRNHIQFLDLIAKETNEINSNCQYQFCCLIPYYCQITNLNFVFATTWVKFIHSNSDQFRLLQL